MKIFIEKIFPIETEGQRRRRVWKYEVGILRDSGSRIYDKKIIKTCNSPKETLQEVEQILSEIDEYDRAIKEGRMAKPPKCLY